MKKILSLIISIMLVLSITNATYAEENNVSHRFYVSANAVSNGDGSQGNPFATIEAAQEAVRAVTAATMTGDVEVIIGEGVYTLTKTLKFSKEDSGNNGFKVKWIGENFPLISGGKKLTGWTQAENGMWKTIAEGFDFIRELYVNDTRVNRASMEREVTGLGDYDDPATAYGFDGIYLDKRVLDTTVENADQIDFRWGIGWKGSSAKVDRIIPDPTDSSRVIAMMTQPLWYGARTVPDWGHVMRPDFGFRIENVFEFLDHPGEYYFNKTTKEIFYMPREGEDMTTADVYAPVLEQVMIIDGMDHDVAENIQVEGLRFAHAAFNLPSEVGGYHHGQQQNNFVGRSWDERNTSGGVIVRNAKDITLKGNVFYGMGAAGLEINYNTADIDVVGNAVYDTGEAGMIVGDGDLYSYRRDTEPSGYREDMVWRSFITTSDAGAFGQYIHMLKEGGAWAAVNDVKAGKKSFIKFEFDMPVSVDEITIKVDGTDDIEEKRNFEVLLSNDPEFNSAVSVHKQKNVGYDGSVLSVKPTTNEKFKYCMIRKTEVEKFAMDEVSIYTKDIKWSPRLLPQNISITDNYITRVGNYYYGGAGIAYICGLDGVLDHNEIYYTPYSAMSVGWGWDPDSKVSKRTIVSNNLVDTYNVEIQDGGAIYTLSRQDDSKIFGNYLKNEYGPFGSLYFDNGSSDFTVYDNVVENSANSIFIWTTDQHDNTVTNTYTNAPNITALGTNCTVEDVKTFVSGNPQPEAKAIMDNAGIRPEYISIKSQVPDNEAYYGRERMDMYSSIYYHYPTDTYNQWTSKIAKIGDNALKTENIGSLPGQYSASAKLVLQSRVEEMRSEEKYTDSNGVGQIERYLRVEDATREFEKSLNRLSLEDTLLFATEMLNNTEVGSRTGNCTSEAKTVFEQAILAANDTSADEYTRLRNLEQAISDFDHATINADVMAFKFDGIDAPAVIDEDNRTIEIAVDESVNVKKLTANAVVSPNAQMFPDISKNIDYTYPVQTVVKNGDNAKVWTVKVTRQEGHSYEAENWWNWMNDKAVQDGNKIVFPKSDEPYMLQGIKASDINMNIKADYINKLWGINVVFDSVNGELLTEGISNVNSYFELVIKEDVIYLYRIEGEKKKLLFGSTYDKEKVFEEVIKTSDFISNLKENIALNISCEPVGAKKRVTVNLNGKTAINALCDVNNNQTEGYFGVYSPNSQMYAEMN